MGRLRARCNLGFVLNTQVHHCRDEPGIVGAAIYRAILIDQHSLRSHPNKAVDVVVCQTSWIESGSRFINFGPAESHRTAVAIRPARADLGSSRQNDAGASALVP